MNHAIQGAGGRRGTARRRPCTAINALAHDLCLSLGASTADIVDVAICGNTAMHHLLLGLPVRQLGRAPFVAAVRDAMDVKARDLGLAVCPGAYVHLAPNIGGFVGSDHVDRAARHARALAAAAPPAWSWISAPIPKSP